MWISLAASADFINVLTSLAGGFFMNMPYFYYGNDWVIFVMVFVVIFINYYCCYTIVKSKRYIVASAKQGLATASLRSRPNEAELDKFQKRMESYIQVTDLADYAFGWFGRFVIECSLIIAQFTIAISLIAGIVKDIHVPLAHCKHVNLTETNYTECRIKTEKTYFYLCKIGNANPIYMIIAGVIFSVLSLIPKPRYAAPLSLVTIVSMLIVVIIAVVQLFQTSELNDNYGIWKSHLFTNYASLSIPWLQMVIQVIPIENSMKGTRHLYTIFLSVSAGFCLVICITFASGIFITGFKFRDIECLFFRMQRIPLINMLGLFLTIGLYPIQNFPLIDEFERRFGSCASCQSNDEDALNQLVTAGFARDLSLARENKVSDLFRTLRGIRVEPSDRILPNDVSIDQELNGEQLVEENVQNSQSFDIGRSLEIEKNWCWRFFIRLVLVGLQVALAAVTHISFDLIKILTAFSVFASRLIAFIFPCALNLKTAWRELSNFRRCLNILIVIAALAETTYSLYRIFSF